MLFRSNTGFFIAGSIGNAVGPNYVVVTPSALGVSSSAMPTSLSSRPSFPLQTMGYFGALGELGYNFMENFGVEFYGAYLGEQRARASTTAGGKLWSWAFGGNLIAYLPFANNKADVFAKAGIGGMYSKFTAASGNFTSAVTAGSRSVNTTKPIYDFGVGVQYYYTDDVTIRGSWDQFARWNNNVIGNLRYNLWTLGLDYHFTI